MSQKGFIPIAVILISLIVGMGGYLIYTKSQVKVPAQKVVEPSPNPSPVIDSTANWTTYRGNGFEFKYPSNGAIITEELAYVYISSEERKPYFTFTVSIEDNPKQLTTKQVVDDRISSVRNNKNWPTGKSQADQMVKTMKEYTNEQITGIRLQDFDEGYPQGFGSVVEATEDKIYSFHVGDGSGGSVGENEEKLLDQIISTFKFSDKVISANGNGCIIGGCGKVCLDEEQANNGPLNGACVVDPEDVCYEDANCKKQADGKCGWTMTAEMKACLKNSPNLP